MNVKETEIKALLLQHQKFVTYGLSPDHEKASHDVPAYMRLKGWDQSGL